MPRVALVYSQRLLRMEMDQTLSIQEALTEKCDYAELMGWERPSSA